MQRPLSVLSPVEQYESRNWRALALGMAALLAQMPEHEDPLRVPGGSLREPQEGMLNVVARQLKAPVATLRAHAARLEEQAAHPTESETTREVASRIVEQADLMAEWVSAILDVQRIRLGKLQLTKTRLDLIKFARAAVDELADEGATEIRFLRSGPSSEPVLADGERLSQVLGSMLRRAVAHAHGRAIELRVTRRDWTGDRPHAVVSVGEVGRDVSDDDFERILRSHRELDQDLDLYVAREIIRLHGGELGTDRGLGGATIVVLPVEIPHRSHAVLARGRPCSPIRLAR
jgi:signal transduction histidine kinase